MDRKELLAKANLLHKLGVNLFLRGHCSSCQFESHIGVGCKIYHEGEHMIILNKHTKQLEYIKNSADKFHPEVYCIGFLYPKINK